MGRLVGIDLGTTNSVVAVIEGGEPFVIPLAEGTRLCPSVVGFSRTGERLVGQLAKRQAITNPDRTVSSIKRKMGTNHKVVIDDQSLSPQEISAMILQKLKVDAEAYLGEPVDRAVITVPAYFNDPQRQATRDAGLIAGLEVLRIINEPTAAALAYGMDKQEMQTVLVWDLGGGTFDVSILELGEGVFEVRATNGDTFLGGDDWDDRIIEYLATEFQRTHGVNLRNDRIAVQRLKEAAEKAKIELSTVVTTSINLPFLSVTTDGPVHLDMALTRAQMEKLTEDLREKMLGPTKMALGDAKMDVSQIDRVILVGGATRMPAVQEMVRTLFQKEPFRGTNPDEVVAVGAAIQAGVLGGTVRDIVLLDVTPLSLGVETQGKVFTRLIPRNTTIPTRKTEIFTTAVDGQTAVDIHVLQGEREFADGNKTLGRFQLTGIPTASRGIPKIEVTFDIDPNGIVSVSARDEATGHEQHVTVNGTSGLTKSEVDRMMRDAEANLQADNARRDVQELRNRGDSLLHNAEKAMRGAQQKGLSEMEIAPVRAASDDLRGLLASSNEAEAIRRKNDVLGEAMYALSAALYRHDSFLQSGGVAQPADENGDIVTTEEPSFAIPVGSPTASKPAEPTPARRPSASSILDEIFQRPARVSSEPETAANVPKEPSQT